jgi:hypothetical protein
MTHVGQPNSVRHVPPPASPFSFLTLSRRQSEILGNLKALNAFSGIPLSSLSGFRAPMLNFSADTLIQLHAAEFQYDSSATAGTPADADGTDAWWPYTLDNGTSAVV